MIVAILVLVLVVGGAAYADREVEPRGVRPRRRRSGELGDVVLSARRRPEGWEVFLQVANPGDAAATVRVRTLGCGAARRARDARGRARRVRPRPGRRASGASRASAVEWFGQWVAVGWLAHAGGGEGGVAAEPCAPAAGSTWLLPDGTSEAEEDDDFVVVMNPFARQAVFSLALLSERQEPVRHSDLTDVVLEALPERVVQPERRRARRTHRVDRCSRSRSGASRPRRSASRTPAGSGRRSGTSANRRPRSRSPAARTPAGPTSP